ncbi:MAG TPA: hypothetical protein VD694_07790 [Nitrososphaeraceae archaeon]|nr:hypothetical protein [Nitrososphaeraceae archaeon]
MLIDNISTRLINIDTGISRYEQFNNDVIICLAILFTFTFTGLIITTVSLADAQEQQQQILPETTISNFTLNIDVLGVNSETRNSTISIVGPEDETLTSNTTIDLFSKAQQDFASESNPVALTIPININSSLLHDGDELKACLTMVDTNKVDCELTVITQYNLEGFLKSVQLEAGGNIEQQIRDLPK